MAPEIIQKEKYNHQCDIWSAGVILYLLLAGEPPFMGKNDKETIKKIIEGKPTYSGTFFYYIRTYLE